MIPKQGQWCPLKFNISLYGVMLQSSRNYALASDNDLYLSGLGWVRFGTGNFLFAVWVILVQVGS